ncbi:type IV pilus secretin PilQ [Ferrimonas balearica]|uniref:type IV pilus secretin PilQ n=1 Tax=Ferrimonas balearica TaxID=44012 RepID=UPI001C990545|nr:type IV pilus secretin PilQ family protein [Ferrimonas balearica]MBY5923225.1 type IV pilus secretin PilQ family protein [Ferrimonas balearica]MBY5997399.1 type IV pilus secretin PilQ family protein [Ferrimonas balearica]
MSFFKGIRQGLPRFEHRFIARRLLLGGALLTAASSVWAGTLEDLRYQAQVDGMLEVELTFDQLESEPQISVSANPAEIRFRFPDGVSGLQLSQIPIDLKGVKAVETRSGAGGLDVVFQLEKMTTYKGAVDGNRYRVTFNDNFAVSKTETSQFLNRIEDINFHRGNEGQALFALTLSNPTAAANIERIGSDLELTLYNTQIQDEDLYIVDVQDFSTLVRGFETFRDNFNTRIRIDTQGEFDYDTRQEGNRFLIEIAERTQPRLEDKVYAGSALSMNFQDVPVRTVLQIIADHNKFNLVTTENVSGNLTLHLDKVPWDQALDMILKIRGLDKRIEGNILLVAPREELAAQESLELRAAQEVREVAPLFSEYLQINYAKAVDIAALLDGENNSLLSERGSVSVDERTNTLLIHDTAERLEDIHRLVDILDIPVKQVVIESRMVTVRDNINEELGIRWGISDQQGDKGTAGTLPGAEDIANGIIPSLNDRLNVNLPVVEPAGSIAFHVAKLGDGTLLDLELSALERENKGEIIASPRLTTANQFTAFIEQGTEIPFVQSTSSGATSVEFKKAVLGLTVTPQITPDNRIVLDLTVTQDTRGETVQTATGPAVAIDTQRISTQVLAKNGETIVLGGIFQQQQLNTVSKVPVLGDIPLVGVLFRNTQDFTEKKELLIFVTPKIVIEEF